MLGAGEAQAQPASGAGAPLTSPAARRRAMELAGAGRWPDAVPELDAMARTDPADSGLAFLRGQALAHVGRHEEAGLALGEADEILRAAPGDPGGLGLRGRALLALGRAADARPALVAAARALPRDHAAGKAHVRCLAQLGQAIDLDPSKPVLHDHHGCYHREAAEAAKGPGPGPIRASDQLLPRAERLAGPDRRLRALIAWHRGQVAMAVRRALAAESLVGTGGRSRRPSPGGLGLCPLAPGPCVRRPDSRNTHDYQLDRPDAII